MKKYVVCLMLCISMLVILCACSRKEETVPEEVTQKAMYITFGDDLSVFIDQENGNVFYANFPEEIYDQNGQQIGMEALVSGNIIELTGNGVMAESYPGQYYGVTKMQVVETGSPKDAAQYQNIIDEIYQEPDLTQPPELSVSYKTDIAAVSVMASTGSYEWSYQDTSGLTNTTHADSDHILIWEDLIDAGIPKATEFELSFSSNPKEVIVERWPVELWKSAETSEEASESVAVQNTEDIWTMTAEPGFVYLVKGIWEVGYREFGFFTPEQ